MTSDEMSDQVARFFEEANELQWKKNRDYHPERVAFLEILRTASETGISVEQDLWAKIRKQYIALRGYMIDGQLASESPRSRMIDVAVYMGMAAFWDDHKIAIVRDALAHMVGRTICERGGTTMAMNGVCSPDDPSGLICDRCKFMFWLAKNVA